MLDTIGPMRAHMRGTLRVMRVNRSTLVVLMAMALIPTAAAHADSNDDQFVAAVNAAGLPGDRGALIGIAHEWCDA